MKIGDSGSLYVNFGSNLTNYSSKESQNSLNCGFDHPPTFISSISSHSHEMVMDKGTYGGDQRLNFLILAFFGNFRSNLTYCSL